MVLPCSGQHNRKTNKKAYQGLPLLPESIMEDLCQITFEPVQVRENCNMLNQAKYLQVHKITAFFPPNSTFEEH